MGGMRSLNCAGVLNFIVSVYKIEFGFIIDYIEPNYNLTIFLGAEKMKVHH